MHLCMYVYIDCIFYIETDCIVWKHPLPVVHSYWPNSSLMMKKIRFNYSLKNIPLPSPDSYRKRLIEKIERVIIRMRWKAHFPERGQHSNRQRIFRFEFKKASTTH